MDFFGLIMDFVMYFLNKFYLFKEF